MECNRRRRDFKISAWDDYDQTIRTEVADYNQRFNSLPGYVAVNWLLCKAMVWTESGGPASAAWKARAMQIGNPGDPAYAVITGGAEGSSLIMDSQLAADVKAKAIDEPTLNIRAGIAYLFTKMASFGQQPVIDVTDTQDHTYTVVAGVVCGRLRRRPGRLRTC